MPKGMSLFMEKGRERLTREETFGILFTENDSHYQ